MQSFTPNQRTKLLANPNVLKITDSHIIFKPEFMINAVEMFLEGISGDEIFHSHGFDINFFEKDYCKYSLKRWKLKFEVRGEESFYKETRGNPIGRPKNNLDDLTMDELKAIVYIQGELLEEVKKKKALAKKPSSK